MANRASAGRYAKALIEVAAAEAIDLQQVERDLAGFVDLFDAHPALGAVLLNPAVPMPNKRNAVGEIVALAKPTTVVGKLVMLLTERDRLELLPALLAAYHERLLDHLHVVQAEVTTTGPLSPAEAEALRQKLAQVTGRTVTITTKIDPAIVGGVVARIGSTVYDGSVATQLARMREQLVEKA